MCRHSWAKRAYPIDYEHNEHILQITNISNISYRFFSGHTLYSEPRRWRPSSLGPVAVLLLAAAVACGGLDDMGGLSSPRLCPVRDCGRLAQSSPRLCDTINSAPEDLAFR
jgi:hypothetical protein